MAEKFVSLSFGMLSSEDFFPFIDMRERYVPIRNVYQYQDIISILHQIFRKPRNVIFCHCDPLRLAEAETPRRQAVALMPSLMGCRPSRPAPITTTVARVSRPEATSFSGRQGAYRFLRARWPFSREPSPSKLPEGWGWTAAARAGYSHQARCARGACGVRAGPSRGPVAPLARG